MKDAIEQVQRLSRLQAANYPQGLPYLPVPSFRQLVRQYGKINAIKIVTAAINDPRLQKNA